MLNCKSEVQVKGVDEGFRNANGTVGILRVIRMNVRL